MHFNDIQLYKYICSQMYMQSNNNFFTHTQEKKSLEKIMIHWPNSQAAGHRLDVPFIIVMTDSYANFILCIVLQTLSIPLLCPLIWSDCMNTRIALHCIHFSISKYCITSISYIFTSEWLCRFKSWSHKSNQSEKKRGGFSKLVHIQSAHTHIHTYRYCIISSPL